MKYFLDTEFHEYQKKPLFGKPIDTIELISVGIVSEDNYIKGKDYSHPSEYKGREYYAISKDFNLKEAWNRYDLKINKLYPIGPEYNKVYWIRDNILIPIAKELAENENVFAHGENDYFTYKRVKRLINKYGKSNKQIAEEIRHFVANRPIDSNKEEWILEYDTKDVQFYGYYSDYDWVVFCWLFGRMVDLPKGFPMYCIDLKQEIDNHITKTWKDVEMSTFGHQGITLDELKQHPNYPKQTNEHNALADAKWTEKLYRFLNKL